MTIQELLEIHNVPMRTSGHHHCRPGWLQLDCPVCAQEGHYRLGLNLRSNYFACWSCGGQPLVRTLHLLTGLAYKDLKAFDFGRTVLAEEVDVRGKLVLPPAGPLTAHHKRFLTARGLDPTTVRAEWGVWGTSQGGHYAWRVIIPVVYKGQVVSFTTRAVDDSQHPRYLAARPEEERLNHRDLLYGHDLADRPTVIVVEGPLDVWAVGPGCVATFGTAFRAAQVRKLARYARRVICFDAEPAAQKQARKLVRALQPFPGETLNVTLETGKDPSRADQAELAELRRMLV